ncbi:hypothetical protein FOA52_012121 [Chlamydomonas sp. UWO 241]|nr:hypothetical protein FOA52_012121 [Chlamydomonas sp. UWO 241]
MFGPDGPVAGLHGPESHMGVGEAHGRRGVRSSPRVVSEDDVIQMVLAAVEHCRPLMKVQSIKTGTRIVHVPKVAMAEEQRSLAVRWIIAAAAKRKQGNKAVSMAECLALELLLAYRKEGSARAKRDDVHKVALDNKANVAGYNIK